MKWKKFIIKTVADAEDIIISALCDIGMEGAQIEDQVPLTAREKEQMFVDIPLMLPENDDTAILSFYVEEQSDNTLLVQNVPKQENEILEEIKAELDSIRNFMDIGEGTVSVDETEDIDWINNTISVGTTRLRKVIVDSTTLNEVNKFKQFLKNFTDSNIKIFFEY